jgi:hypothetical protein
VPWESVVVVVTQIWSPAVAVPVVTGPVVSSLTETSSGHAVNIGNGPVEDGGELVGGPETRVPNCDAGGLPKTIPSVVKVAPAVGNAMVSLPITTLLGPIMTVAPLGSVLVVNPVPIVMVLPSITMASGEDVCDAGGLPIMIPSVDSVTPGVGIAMVSLPMTIPLGPTMTVSPCSVRVCRPVPIGTVLPSMMMPIGVDDLCDGNGLPTIMPSVVKVAPGVGKGMVSEPMTILLGPTMTVWPLGSVIVLNPVPIGMVLPSMTISSSEEEEDDDEEDEGVGRLPGSSVNVKPSVVMTTGAVTEGSAIESVPIMIPLGPRTTICPFGAVNVTGAVGNGIDVPPMMIPPGAEVDAELPVEADVELDAPLEEDWVPPEGSVPGGDRDPEGDKDPD